MFWVNLVYLESILVWEFNLETVSETLASIGEVSTALEVRKVWNNFVEVT
jgi:hypothetical protein